MQIIPASYALPMLLIDFFLANTILVATLVGLVFAFHALLPDPGRCKIVEAQFPLVSVIVPARNDEKSIGACVQSLLDQDYPACEIVVIDDRSIDDTGRIVKELAEKDSKVRHVAKTEPPPAGWTGKCSALKEGVDHAAGDWFFFVEADTRHQAGSIRSALSFALENKAHMVSFWPAQKLDSACARFVLPTLWSSLFWIDPLLRVNDLSEDKAYALGHGILIDKRAYALVGGHQSVREWIIEDSALAKMVKRKGLSVQIADGRKLFQVEVDLDLKGLWNLWTKMLFALLDFRLVQLLPMLIFINSTLLIPLLQALIVAAMWMMGFAHPWFGQLAILTAIQLLLVLAWYILVSRHYKGLSWWCLLVLPASAVFTSAAYLYSAWLVFRRAEVKWQGGAYTLTRLELPEGR